MRRMTGPEFDPHRVGLDYVRQQIGTYGNRNNGTFLFRLGLSELRVIATSGGGWDHVSVSLEDRTPTWAEMDWVKRKFFRPEEVAMQLHVTAENHVNIHPHVLHLWRPHAAEIPLPPKEFV